MSETVIKNENEEQEIDLIALALRFWEKRKYVIKITSVFIIIGLLFALSLRNKFTSNCVIVPQTASKASGGGLSALASMAGISLGSMGGQGETISPLLYGNVIENIDLQKELIHTPIKFNNFDQPVTLLDYYTKDEYKKFSLIGTIMKYTIGLPGVIIKAIKGDSKEEVNFDSLGEKKLKSFSKDEYDCLEILKNSYSVNVNDKDGYIDISATMYEPLAAAQVAERLKDLLQKYVTEFKIEKAQENYNFLNDRYEEAKKDFEKKQELFARFQDENKVLSTAASKIKNERISSEYSLANSLFTELSKQRLQAEIKLKEDTPIFTIIEPVKIANEKSEPSRAMILIAFAFLGGILACGSVLLFDYLKDKTEVKYPKNWN